MLNQGIISQYLVVNTAVKLPTVDIQGGFRINEATFILRQSNFFPSKVKTVLGSNADAIHFIVSSTVQAVLGSSADSIHFIVSSTVKAV